MRIYIPRKKLACGNFDNLYSLVHVATLTIYIPRKKLACGNFDKHFGREDFRFAICPQSRIILSSGTRSVSPGKSKNSLDSNKWKLSRNEIVPK